MVRTLEELSIEEIQILQITKESGTTHKLGIMSQIKQYFTHANREFNIDLIQKTLDRLVVEGLIRYIKDLDSYSITELGQDILFS
ncbi:MAG: hypothetical protein ACFFD1_03630 [Candidatus Thorarchaeota archaeon]